MRDEKIFKQTTNQQTKTMKKEQVLSIVRHALTFAGGVLIAKGAAEAGVVNEAVGAIVSAVGLVWGLVEKITRKGE